MKEEGHKLIGRMVIIIDLIRSPEFNGQPGPNSAFIRWQPGGLSDPNKGARCTFQKAPDHTPPCPPPQSELQSSAHRVPEVGPGGVVRPADAAIRCACCRRLGQMLFGKLAATLSNKQAPSSLVQFQAIASRCLSNPGPRRASLEMGRSWRSSGIGFVPNAAGLVLGLQERGRLKCREHRRIRSRH